MPQASYQRLSAGMCHPHPRLMQGSDVRIEKDVIIGTGVQLYGKTVIGRGARIEGPTCITDAEIGVGVYVRSFSVVEDAVIGEGSGVGPFARLREGTRLGPNSYLGNFVETKNAKIGRNTLACHLTYLGDAEVGFIEIPSLLPHPTHTAFPRPGIEMRRRAGCHQDTLVQQRGSPAPLARPGKIPGELRSESALVEGVLENLRVSTG
jgi:UDP-3-O-[3-hydroxymyristoyl] glucosamine N-acyltransferase